MTAAAESEARFRRAFILLLLVIVLAVFIGMIRNFLIALFLAALFTSLIYPVQRRLCARLRGHEHLSAAIVVVVFLLAIGLPVVGLLGLVAAEALQISEKAGPWLKEQIEGGTGLAQGLPAWVPFADELAPYRTTLLEKAGEAVGASGTFLVGAIPDFTRGTIALLLNLLIFVYAMFTFLVDGPEMLSRAKEYVPLRAEDRDRIVTRGYSVARASLKGILIIGFVQAAMIGVAFWIIGIQGVIFWSAIVFVLSAIPALGPVIIWVPAAIYLFVTGDVGWGIALTLWGAIVVGLADNVLRPIVVGREAKLPDLLVLVSTLGGIAMFGAVGILIGPILAAIVITALHIYEQAFCSVLPADDSER